MIEEIKRHTNFIIDEVTNIRRDLHKNPELYFREYYTTNIAKKYLSKYDVNFTSSVSETGVVGLIEGASEGKIIALRADMDALPIKEETGLPYASEFRVTINDTELPVMHACGHDGHTAILIGSAYVLSKIRDRLRGKVKLLFQPAEEKGAGADKMVKAGVLKNPKVDAIFALHGNYNIPVGKIGIRTGPVSAYSQVFHLTVKGKGAHGAYPHESVDPVIVAANIVNGIQNISSRETDPKTKILITIGSIQGGSLPNIIPDKVELKGTIRTISRKDKEFATSAIKRISENVAKAFRANVVIELIEGYPAVINTPKETKIVENVVKKVLGEDKLEELEVSMGSEDFAYFLQKCPGTMFSLGLKDKEHIHKFPHTSKFDFNDNALKYGILIMSAISVKYLNGKI